MDNDEIRWVRTGQELEDMINEMILFGEDIFGIEIAEAVEGIAQDRAVTLLIEHFNISESLASEIYNKHF